MIGSATHLISEVRENILEHKYSVASIKNAKIEAIDEKKITILHIYCTFCYFGSLSWKNKLKMLTMMVNSCRSTASLALLLNTVYGTTRKLTNYQKVIVQTDFVYDKRIIDHDRMLERKTIEKTIDLDIEWFETLPDNDQVGLLISLMRMSGGGIIEQLYERVKKSYNMRIREKSATPTVKYDMKSVKETKDKTESKPKEPENEADTVTIKVKQLTKQWDDIINKYRRQVDPPVKGGKKGDKSGGKGGKKDKKSSKGAKSSSKSSKKSSKGSKKKGKGGKSSKKSSKGSKKKGKGGKADIIDRIQLMPVQIVKKILNYLDDKTLKSSKKVNKYWNYVITELLDERKVRRTLTAANEKLKAHMDKDWIERRPQVVRKTSAYPKATIKRMEALEKRGAAIKSYQNVKGELDRSCLVMKSLREMEDVVVFPTKNVSMFPRLVTTVDVPLYQPKKCIIKDMNMMFVWEYDNYSEESINMMDYQLSTATSIRSSEKSSVQSTTSWKAPYD